MFSESSHSEMSEPPKASGAQPASTATSYAQTSIDVGIPLTAEINDGSKNRNPKGLGLLALIAEDFRTHGGEYLSQGFWTLFWHRLGNARMDIRPRLLRVPFSVAYWTLQKVSEWFCGISLPYSVVVGRRVKIEHFGGIVLIARAIGDDVVIRQNTTFGIRSVKHIGEQPVIGDGVDIGVGAVILGNITIGKNAVVGANAVVLEDVPAETVVGGIPARPLKAGAM